MTKIHLNVKGVRYRLGVNCMTHKAFAEGLGVSPSYLSQLISGKRSPSLPLRKKFMEVLKCDRFDDLFVIRDVSQGEKNT